MRFRPAAPVVSYQHAHRRPVESSNADDGRNWSDAVRPSAGLTRALLRLDNLDNALDEIGMGSDDRAFNLAWHDWLNLKSLIATSRATATAALARDDSCGAHFREDHPTAAYLSASTYTVVRQHDHGLEVMREPVVFTRIRPPAPA